MEPNLEALLKQLGWTDGFKIPIANDENKQLEEEFAKLTFRKHKASQKLDNVLARLNGLKDHLKFVNQESYQTQKLITLHTEQLENMKNVFSDTKTDNRNALHAIKISTQQLKDGENAQLEKKTELQKLIAKADKVRMEMDWDTEALKAWEEALQKRDEDISLLKEFFIEDERRFNQLEARRRHLKGELISLHEKIELIASNYHSCEYMTERTGKVIKELSVERDALINQWKNTVKVLKDRDNDIMRTQEKLVQLSEVLQKAEERLDKQNKLIANEEKNNKELELEILEANNISAKYRNELADMYQYLMRANTEV